MPKSQKNNPLILSLQQTEKMLDKIKQIEKEIEDQVLDNLQDLEDFRLKFLSKKGLIPSLFTDFKNIAPEERKSVGLLINKLKEAATLKHNKSKEKLEQTDSVSSSEDLTRPGTPVFLGTRHPLSHVRNEIVSIFSRLGFTISEGPEIEDDDHVFSRLNFPPEHPARDMQDTFFIKRQAGEDSSPEDILLRTHTSSVQVRVMQSENPPIRTISPGRVFRNEAISARAHCIFHQVEGLYIDEDVSFADLKQTLLFSHGKCLVQVLKSD